MQMWMLGVVFALVGVPMVWLAQRTFARDRAIARWPRAPGVVISSQLGASLETYRDKDGHNSQTTVYRPQVRYTYTVNGQVLNGERISRSLEGAAVDEAAAKRCIDTYPAQQQVQVLYQPDDPKQAWLEVRRSTGAVILFAFGCVWLALGALLVVLST